MMGWLSGVKRGEYKRGCGGEKERGDRGGRKGRGTGRFLNEHFALEGWRR